LEDPDRLGRFKDNLDDRQKHRLIYKNQRQNIFFKIILK